MERLYDEHEAELLSAEFSKVLNEWLDKKTIAEIVAKNAAEEDKSVCASHEYCDPNQAMIDAFTIVFHRQCDISNENEIALINAAWDMSKKNEFNLSEVN